MAQLASPNIAPARPARRVLGRTSAAATAIATVVLLGLPLVVTASLVPRCETILRDFGVALPELSRLFINAGRALSTPLGWAAIGAFVLLIATPGSIAVSRRPALASALLLLALALAISYALLFALGMFLPMTSILDSLHQGGKP